MFAELNSKIGAQLNPMGAYMRGSEPMTGDESEGPMTPLSQEVGSVFGSDADECAASVAGSIHPSTEGATGSESRVGAAAGVIS